MIQTTTAAINTLTSAIVSPTQNTFEAWTEIEGFVIVTAAGTLQATGLVSVAADTIALNSGSYMEVLPV